MATELTMECRTILRLMGTEPDGPALLLGDNNSAVINCAMPNSVLKKKASACSCHRVREAIAAGIIQYYHIDGKDNPADVLTKFLPHSKWWPLVKPLLHWLEEVKKKVSKATKKKITKYQPVGGVERRK